MTVSLLECDLRPLRDYVSQTLLNGRHVADDDELLLSGLLDSLSVMSLVSFVEKEYALAVPFEDVLIEHFESLRAIGGYLSRRMQDA